MISEETQKMLWEVKFPSECEKLPFSQLNSHEKELVQKCICHDNLTETEKDTIQQLLYNYRPYFSQDKYDITKISENKEKFTSIISTENELLRIINDPNRYRLDFKYYAGNGEVYLLQFRINPITQEQFVEEAEKQLKFLEELNESEKQIYSKAQNQIPLSPEETKMLEHINTKLLENNQNSVKKNLHMIEVFLTDHLEFLNSKFNRDEKLKFWEQIDPKNKITLFNEVSARLNLTDTFKEDLFPVPR